MPRIHLETSSDLPQNANIPDILDALVAVLSEQESVKSETVKAWHSIHSNWSVGEGHPPAIAHCTVYLLTGRSPELRAVIAEAMATELRRWFCGSLVSGQVGLTLDLREMNADTYRKITAK